MNARGMFNYIWRGYMRRRFKWVSLALVAAMVIGVIAYDGYASKSGAANRTTSSINLNVDHEISVPPPLSGFPPPAEPQPRQS